MVQSGEIQLEKLVELITPPPSGINKSPYPRSQRRSIVVSIVSSSTIIGEEVVVLEGNGTYRYTCTVISPTAVILIADAKSIL